jgi:formylglycine-generating enzyme required for sulfatase activity
MLRSTRWRLVGACGLLILSGLLCCRGTAADVEPGSDVDLTVGDGAKQLTNSIGMKLARIPKGKFWMGAQDNELGAQPNEKPRHQVEISRDFYVGVYEVTQKQWKQVMGNNPSYFSKEGAGRNLVQGMDTDDFPVDQVSWNDAQKFLEKLNSLSAEKGAGRKYRLPTEAEWEYACRAGPDVKDPFTFAKPSKSASSKQANFNGNSPYGGGERGASMGRTCKVGSYKANPFGLYDMHGNCIEWCEDWLLETVYREKDRKDPTGPKTGQYKILRSGGYNYDATYCRSSYRNYTTPDYRNSDSGFRVACVLRRD